MQHTRSDAAVKEGGQSRSPMTCQRDEVDFLPYGEIDDRRHDGTERHVDVGVYPFLPQARLESLQVTSGIFIDPVDNLRVQGRNGVNHAYRHGDGLDHLQKENLRLVVSSGKIFHGSKDRLGTF
jgi:hypothetical protein